MTSDIAEQPQATHEAKHPFAPTLNPHYPTAWWIIALSEDVPAGQVAPVRALEQDLVHGGGRAAEL